MTDSRGRLVDFTNTVLVLTSNLGGEEIAQGARKRVGFSQGDQTSEDTEKLVVAAARRALAPELFNRIDEVLPFSPLTRDDVRRIGRKLCTGLADEMELSRGVYLSICDSAIEVLLDQGGFDPQLGARPLRRMIARKIEAPLAEAILAGELSAGDTWMVEGEDGELCFDVVGASRAGAAE
jgi:ATP-dependent Clp protease ATP-binding subunit ClpC